MYELKTKENDNSVLEYIESVEHPGRREDAYRLLDLFTETSGFPARMWGKSMIGFGAYHYRYASGHEGDAALVAFAPGKARISLYLSSCDPDREELLEKLGKHKAGKGCVYINKVADIDPEVLKALITHTIEHLQATYPANSGT
ncbi:DUF1801 domain-containing protein [Paenibacillus daejeonensis]|uniref:DUF1801 domain-containing protein n=1 Tax=Paenibacillus daejeonensis TaxID=135193 RepID=UPI000360E70D|nr:DUF1801 domain-containing protein [Paenibacillus daejeonensis]